MLVLTRKVGEVVLIDGGIEVHVVAIMNGRIRLGFVAPQEIRIVRKEIKRAEISGVKTEEETDSKETTAEDAGT